MKKVKKNLFSIGLAFSMILGVAFSFVPQEVEARDFGGLPRCFHSVSGSTGIVNFCSGSVCVERTGAGSAWAKCGGTTY